MSGSGTYFPFLDLLCLGQDRTNVSIPVGTNEHAVTAAAGAIIGGAAGIVVTAPFLLK